MKKSLLLILLVLPTYLYGKSSDIFVEHYNHYALWNEYRDDWDTWKKGAISVIFNYNNEPSKIKIFYADGKEMILTPVTGVREGSNNKGTEYQRVKYIADSGREVYMILFANGQMALWYDDNSGIIFTNH